MWERRECTESMFPTEVRSEKSKHPQQQRGKKTCPRDTAQTLLDPITLRGEPKTLKKEFLRGKFSGKRLEKLNIDTPQSRCQKQQKHFKQSWRLLTATSSTVRENVAVAARRKRRPSRGPRLHQRSRAQVGEQPHLVYKLANKNGDLQLSEVWQSPPPPT